MQKFLLVFAVLGLVFVLGADADEEFDSFSVTVQTGDTPWGQWKSFESTKAVPWEIWLDQFAGLNQVVPNEEESFRHLPVGEWLLPIYRQMPEMATEILATVDEKSPVAEITEISDETTFAVISKSQVEVELEETRVQLAASEGALARLEGENQLLEGRLDETTDLLSARDADSKAGVENLQALLASKEEALKAAKAQATTVVNEVWGLNSKQLFVIVLGLALLILAGTGGGWYYYRKEKNTNHAYYVLVKETQAVCSQLLSLRQEHDLLKESHTRSEAKNATLQAKLDEAGTKIQAMLAEMAQMKRCLYKYNLREIGLQTEDGKDYIYLIDLRPETTRKADKRVLLLRLNANGNRVSDGECKLAAVAGKLKNNPHAFGLVVWEEGVEVNDQNQNGKNHELAEYAA